MLRKSRGWKDREGKGEGKMKIKCAHVIVEDVGDGVIVLSLQYRV